MPLLYYWQRENYQRDLDMGAGYHLNQANPIMHEIYIGQSLWAFTRAPDGRYALAAELVTRAKTINPPKFRYGPYRVWGDLTASRYFQVDNQPNTELVLRSLSPKMNAAYSGPVLSRCRRRQRITLQDDLTLTAIAKHLPLEPRACVLPEERLEAAVLLGDEAALERLVRDQPSGIAEKRRAYLLRTGNHSQRPTCAAASRHLPGQMSNMSLEPQK